MTMSQWTYKDATHCRRGHDLTKPGAIETDRKRGGKHRCTECRRERQRIRAAELRKKRSDVCRKGHALTGANLRLVERGGGKQIRFCNTCLKAKYKYRSGVAKPEDVTRERYLTRAILWLDEQRERAATWWDKAEFAERKATLLGVAQ
jgi:hypothetical protein